MIIRFLADEDLNRDIVRGLRLREPTLDILDIKDTVLRGRTDDAVLDFSAAERRIVLTHDRNTMISAFRKRQAAAKRVTSLMLVSQRSPKNLVIDSLVLAWNVTSMEDWHGTITFLPFR